MKSYIVSVATAAALIASAGIAAAIPAGIYEINAGTYAFADIAAGGCLATTGVANGTAGRGGTHLVLVKPPANSYWQSDFLPYTLASPAEGQGVVCAFVSPPLPNIAGGPPVPEVCTGYNPPIGAPNGVAAGFATPATMVSLNFFQSTVSPKAWDIQIVHIVPGQCTITITGNASAE